VVGVVTGWPVGAALAAAAAWWLPRLFGKDAAYAAELAKIEAIATWAEQLRDTLVAASGLEQAIDATAATAPAPIRGHVVNLSAQLHAGTDLAGVLRSFGDTLADPTGDLVVAALLMSATDTARDLHGLLSALAHTARAQASMRLRVAAGRARTRASARLIVAVTLIVAGALVLFNRPYLTPYDTAAGQLMLAIVGGIFATAFWWMARLSRMPRPARILASTAEPTREEAQR
jgi:Flp pilus assembly protein TadB